MLEFAPARARLVTGLVGLDMLREVIELNVTAGHDRLSGGVVLDVIGAQPGFAALHVDISVRVEDSSHFALLVGFESDLGAGGRSFGENL
jgi:hypothetical protein